MASGDWIKLHRRLLDHPIMQHDGICRLWVYCLMRANWKQTRWMIPGTTTGIDIPRGSFITGRFELHATLYPKRGKGRHTADIPSASTVWRWLLSLQEMQCITVSNVNNRCSMVTVCNYGTYQDDKREERTAGGQPVNNRWTTGEQPVDTEEERKEQQEEKEKKEREARAQAPSVIKLHEAAFMAMRFRDRFEAIVKRHPVKDPPMQAESNWKLAAVDEETAEKIDNAHANFCASQRWKDGIGIPSLKKFLAEGYWENPPQPEKPRDNAKRAERTSARYDPAIHG